MTAEQAIVVLRRVAWVLVGWCLMLATITYLGIRETQRMLCHERWPEYSADECATHFTGSTLAQLVVLGIGSAVFLGLALAWLPKLTDRP